MNRLLSMVFVCMLQVSLALASTFNLKVEVTPDGSGSVNTSGGTYEEGSSIYLRAYNNTGFVFKGWYESEKLLSSSSSFYYTMPANDAVVQARYEYDPSVPENPANPESMTKYTVTMSCKPEGSGSFNTSSATAEEGSSVHLYAYTNNGFKFLHWEDAKGNIIASEQNFYYVMPHGNSQIYGVFEYDPSNPSNPGKNYWNKETGEVIVDDFTPGNLSSEISTVTNGSTSKITTITVAGKMSSNDFSIVNNYSNCTSVDLSRTSGVNTIPSYCYNGNTHISSIYLPACITSIEYRAFYNASSLTELTCYATVPPTLGNQVFTGVTSGLIVYVPASSVELYENAAGWKDYVDDGTIIIMPIREHVSSLEVNLPAECSDGRYKNMPLELVNVKSGQKYKYVITDRINYIFNNLVHGTEYIVTLKNLSGAVLAKSETIAIVDEDVVYDFVLANMKQLRTVQASVMAPSGEDVTSQTTINWYDESDTFLSQGTDISGQVSGSKIKCSITLPQTLGMQYVLPTDSVYEVVEGENTLVYTLTALPTLAVKGVVIDKTTRLAISGASVTVSQTLNNKYSKSLTTQTDSKGNYTLQAFVAPSTVTFSADDYVSQTISIPTGEDWGEADTVKMKPITGATITTNFTYTPSVAANVEPETQSYYSDYNNVDYAIYNETAKKAISQFNVQYPSIVLLEEVDENDSLTITAKSKNSAFKDIVVGGRIDQSNHMSVTIPVVQWGGIEATFTQTENSSVIGILYDADGKFVKKYTYGSATLSISELKDGEYTLVTMGESTFFGSIYDISNFKDAGLQENIDYVVNKVSVSSGVITSVKNVLIPFFDESKFYYTGDNTSFTVNKTSVIAGNYLTLTAKVDFKDTYKKSIKDKNLVVELPEGTTFVDNSVMVGSAIAYYELKGNTLIIPLENTPVAERIRFCIVPTKSGSYAPNAAIAFKLNGKSISQPIGSANYTVKELSIKVPSETNSPEITVCGVTTGKADVIVYADDEVIGTTKALANGHWSLTANLRDPHNLQTTNIYANINTETGLSVNTGSKSCLYNKDKVIAKNVEMSFYNGWLKKNVSVAFDLENATTSSNSYMFYTATDITFAATLNTIDTALVSSVTINVYTDKSQWFNLPAQYNANLGKWIAVKNFPSNNLPIGVKVNVVAKTKARVDAEIIKKSLLTLPDMISEMKQTGEKTDSMMNALFLLLDAEDSDVDATTEMMKNIASELGCTFEGRDIGVVTDEYFEALKARTDSLLNSDDIVTSLDSLLKVNMYQMDNLKEYLNGITVLHCEGLEESAMEANGYTRIEKTDGGYIYVLTTKSKMEIVDFSLDVRIIVESESPLYTRKHLFGESSIEDIEEYCGKIKNYISDIQAAIQAVADCIDQVEKKVKAANKQILQELMELFKEAEALERHGGSRFEKLWVETQINLLWKAKEANQGILNFISEHLKQFKIGSVGGRAFGAFGIISAAWDGYSDLQKVIGLYKSTIPCPNDEEKASAVRSSIVATGAGAGLYYVAQLVSSIASVAGMETGIIGAVPSGGVSLSAVAVSVGLITINCAATIAYTHMFGDRIKELQEAVNELDCYGCKCGEGKVCTCPADKCKCKKCNEEEDDDPPYPTVNPIHDPSGFVYEGVSSNRLQGVTATCYYKETVEDMYGDLHENIVLWDAEEYAQQNPLFTDENGLYQWDVPQGLWQVKFEKEGYITTQSEWLPVPPPQMDVNIAMVQNAQPEVIKAKAYEDGVEVEFSKYMNIESLNNDNLYVKVVKGSEESLIQDAKIELLNKEAAIEGSETSYASKVKLATDTLEYFDEAYLIISTGVSSYAGISMAQTFEQKLDIEKRVRTLLVDSVFNVAYNDSVEITIAATPAEAAVSKTLSIKSASDMIAKTNVSQATFDADGQIKLKVSGELLGSTAIQYSLDDADLTATSLVNVVDPSKLVAVIAPVASRISGTAVYRGQTVSLSCESEGATIYYTTDGSCPCDNASRIKYERPIVINDAMTLKIMAIGTNFDESEVRTYSYTIRQSDVKLNLAKGWNWSSHDMASPLDINELSGIASRILTQTDEVIDDPVFGFVGTLTSVDGTQAMKIETKKDTIKAFAGEQYNPSLTSITLQEGWNWLGYPVSQTMTLSDAFSYLDVDEGDCITNLDYGFVTYNNGAWKGTFQTLTPGSGYLYKSGSTKSFIYNTVPTVSNAKALYGHRLATSEAPWSVNKHSYPSIMPVIAQVCYSDGSPADSAYYVGVFAGDECRGVGEYTGDVMYLTVYGDNSVDLSFKAYNKESGNIYDIPQTLKFNPDVVGSNSKPYCLVLGTTPTGISNVLSNGSNVKSIYSINGVKLNSITTRGIYIINTTDANGHSVMQKQYVK